MKKIIIFGATGNVGSYLTKYCAEYFNEDEFEIIAVGRRQTGVFEKMGIKYYQVDLTEKEGLAKLPVKDVHTVMLLAAEIPSYMSVYKPEKYINSNIIGAFNVLEYCRKAQVDRILYTQTVFDISLYDTEKMVLKPDLPKRFSYKGDHAVYVISKNTAIELIEHYHQEYGIKKFIFRLPTIYSYSPYQYYYPNGVKTIRPVYLMINRAKNSEPIELWGDPDYAKDMVHVYDFSQMLCKAVTANREEGFYNVGTGMPVTLKEQIKTIIKVFSPENNPSPILYCPEKPYGGGFLMDVTNAKKELGYEPQFDCLRLFQDYKSEMEKDRFKELRVGENIV